MKSIFLKFESTVLLERKYIPMYYPESNLNSGLFLRGSASTASGSTTPYGFSGLSLNSAPMAGPSFSMVAQMPHHRVAQSDRVEYDSAPAFPSKLKEIEIRKTFPETWIFDTLEFNST